MGAEIKGEKLRLEGIRSAILDRKANIDQYSALTEYAKGKIIKYEKDPSEAEEIEKLKDDIEKAKERIMKINENLKMELKNYSKNRMTSLNKMMGFSCSISREIGMKLIKFSENLQKYFPIINLEPGSDKKVAVDKYDEFKLENNDIEFIDYE